MTKGIVLLQENARSHVAINHVVTEAKIIQQILIQNYVQYSPHSSGKFGRAMCQIRIRNRDHSEVGCCSTTEALLLNDRSENFY